MTVGRSGLAWGLLLLALVAFYIFNPLNEGQKTLRIYSWSGYFPDDAIKAFEEQNALSVEISYFSSNEELFAKMVAGASGYDIVLPSDYMVKRMIDRNMLMPLDHQELPSLSNISEEFFRAPFDPGLSYSVPYTSGNTGLLINTKAIPIADESDVSWSMLFESPDIGHTSMLDDMREVFAAMLFWRGFGPNERRMEILSQANQDIARSKKNITLFSSEPAALVIKGEINIAHAFTNHAVQAAALDPAFKFIFPREGAITWTDNLTIPKDARHPKEAIAFIEFFLNPENAVEATRTNGLGTPNKAAWSKLTPEEQTDPVLYPSVEQKKRLHFLEDLQGESLQNMSRLWTEMKSS